MIIDKVADIFSGARCKLCPFMVEFYQGGAKHLYSVLAISNFWVILGINRYARADIGNLWGAGQLGNG